MSNKHAPAPMWNIVADENMPLVEELFASIDGKPSQIKRLPGREITQSDLVDTDILLVRSVTKVNRKLLADTKVRFVGTATIGTDHIDLDYLASQGIQFSSAPGCNAQGVVEYVLTSIAYWAEQRQKDLSTVKVGIIGAGNVGSRVARTLQRLGINYVVNDPPLAEMHEQGDFVDLTQIGKCDVITCHVPLVKDGEHPTYHLISETFLKQLPDESLLINSSRGPVLDNKAALDIKRSGKAIDYILDVWEGEPDVNIELMDKTLVATPHIAGYSQEGKIRGTYQLYRAVHSWLQVDGDNQLQDFLPDSPKWQWNGLLKNLYQTLKPFYDLEADDSRMRTEKSDIKNQFDGLRKNYPQRLEFLDNL
ncbi:4-phosphoerythronate dehydrogenase [Kangiella sediminilitoris]|uniref:Erythronate-4-phosphate dehydrogenase n=1 Tax=Kangiella sediminilitoris TaxID=1144748 RepID=A0A1B3B9T3_9GAMM|nr:4-phosphoerythronate dehydrogenase [Kangiella sediminilitoris]AOE49553.1 Erythronate-4-phosphate dehydrogenase [Kangiella sediminilitoris]